MVQRGYIVGPPNDKRPKDRHKKKRNMTLDEKTYGTKGMGHTNVVDVGGEGTTKMLARIFLCLQLKK